jgi:hypothetical protein
MVFPQRRGVSPTTLDRRSTSRPVHDVCDRGTRTLAGRPRDSIAFDKPLVLASSESRNCFARQPGLTNASRMASSVPSSRREPARQPSRRHRVPSASRSTTARWRQQTSRPRAPALMRRTVSHIRCSHAFRTHGGYTHARQGPRASTNAGPGSDPTRALLVATSARPLLAGGLSNGRAVTRPPSVRTGSLEPAAAGDIHVPAFTHRERFRRLQIELSRLPLRGEHGPVPDSDLGKP